MWDREFKVTYFFRKQWKWEYPVDLTHHSFVPRWKGTPSTYLLLLHTQFFFLNSTYRLLSWSFYLFYYESETCIYIYMCKIAFQSLENSIYLRAHTTCKDDIGLCCRTSPKISTKGSSSGSWQCWTQPWERTALIRGVSLHSATVAWSVRKQDSRENNYAPISGPVVMGTPWACVKEGHAPSLAESGIFC
jgi:hypothetical protein